MYPFKPAPGARITFFHVLWLAAVLATAFMVWSVANELSALARITLACAAAVVAVPIVSVLVMILVTGVVIPRLGRNTAWQKEVDAYMLSMLGERWANAGRDDHVDRRA